MAKRGDKARETIKNTIMQAFPESFIQDKKIYVRAADEGGDMVQFSITLTMPKVPVEPDGSASTPTAADTKSNPNDWTAPVISDEDKDKVSALMKSLGII